MGRANALRLSGEQVGKWVTRHMLRSNFYEKGERTEAWKAYPRALGGGVEWWVPTGVQDKGRKAAVACVVKSSATGRERVVGLWWQVEHFSSWRSIRRVEGQKH